MKLDMFECCSENRIVLTNNASFQSLGICSNPHLSCFLLIHAPSFPHQTQCLTSHPQCDDVFVLAFVSTVETGVVHEAADSAVQSSPWPMMNRRGFRWEPMSDGIAKHASGSCVSVVASASL